MGQETTVATPFRMATVWIRGGSITDVILGFGVSTAPMTRAGFILETC